MTFSIVNWYADICPFAQAINSLNSFSHEIMLCLGTPYIKSQDTLLKYLLAISIASFHSLEEDIKNSLIFIL